MRASEFITEAQGKSPDQDTIDLVKMAWDEGKTPVAIATDLGLSPGSVRHILHRYYKSRQGKLVKLSSALTDDDKTTIVSRFLNQATLDDIGNDYGVADTTITGILKSKLGVDRYNDIISSRKRSIGTEISNKITPEMRDKIRELYITGMSAHDIANAIDNIIAARNVYAAMKREPDYAELRAARDARKQKVKTGNASTTKIYRPGTIGNLRSKGPQSRHTSGVNWPKYG